MAATPKKLPLRSKVKKSDTWDLTSLYASDTAWETAFKKWEKKISKFETFKGTLKESPASLVKCLKFDSAFDREAGNLGTYAFLKTAGDMANSEYQRLVGRFQNIASRAAQAASFIRPEILKIPNAKLKTYLSSKALKPYRLQLERLIRQKPHTLTDKEERLLAMQSEMAQVSGNAFRQLTDSDLKFGSIKNEKGELIELSNATYANFLYSPKRTVRKKAFEQYYQQIEGHENTLAATLSGAIQRDVYYAKARGHRSAREAALFADNMPISVYDNLISEVHKALPALYRYYEIRRKSMKLKTLNAYDTYVPIDTKQTKTTTWSQAVKLIDTALKPLGTEYRQTLHAGLTTKRWSDRYPNQGKLSGAFSSGTYDSVPYIMMNYDPAVLNHVFTLAHEAGHSMHSHYSRTHQPFETADYVIFVAEVASTFNEELLNHHLMSKANTKAERAYLLNREIDDIRGTIIRQTMFAEFEKITHALAEDGEPLTVDCFKKVYSDLIKLYFGPDFTVDPQLELECFRIPHFYRGFYVYKYATGMSAAIALSQKVLNGDSSDLDAYLNFLKSGGSKFPLELLRDAGVDMQQPAPVAAAVAYFETLVDELEELS